MAESLSQEEIKKIGMATLADPVQFCHFFLPHIFPGPIPWVHRGILSILTRKTGFLVTYGELDKIYSNFVVHEDPLDDKSPIMRHLFQWNDDGGLRLDGKLHTDRFVLIMMPRGYAKTSIAGIAVPLYEVCFQIVPFSVYVSHAGFHSVMQLDNVKREISDNQRIRAVFGDLRPALQDDETWSKVFFETNSGMAVAARGKGGQVRGLNHRGKRPSRIRVDDLEDIESVKSDTQRQNTIRWAYGDLMPALPKMDPEAGIVALGTMLHKKDVLAVWAHDPRWAVVRFGVLDRQGDLLWAANMDMKTIAAEKESYVMAGQLHTFYLEYFNQHRDVEGQVFNVDEIQISDPTGDLVHAVYLDPAFSKRRSAHFSCIAVVAMNDKGRLWVRECWLERGADHRRLIDRFFELHKKYGCHNNAGVENIAGQAALESMMREEMFRKGQYFELQGIPNKANKIERIQGILPARYKSGYLHHERHFPQYETQLDEFRPDGSHEFDDGPDGVAGAITLLDPYAAMAAGEDLSKDEYEPLEKVLGGDWRYH